MNLFDNVSSGRSQRLADYSFPADLRIKRQQEFDLVFREGQVVADGTLVLHGVKNEDESQLVRLGLSISKKVGSAPVRNRWKRLIREAFRMQKHEFPSGLLLVARPKKGATADLRAIQKSLPALVRRLSRKLPHA